MQVAHYSVSITVKKYSVVLLSCIIHIWQGQFRHPELGIFLCPYLMQYEYINYFSFGEKF